MWRCKLNKTGICKFCGKEAKLVKSHIIPKFLYEYGENSKKVLSIDTRKKQNTIYQSGIWDYILCENCEKKMFLYDNEFCNFTRINFENYIFSRDDKSIIYLIPNNICNYKYLRKFFVSVIWRASISTKSEFKMVDLNKYEKIALDILNDKYDSENLFSVILFKEPNNKSIKGLNFLEKTKFDNQTAYKIYFGDFQINIIINSKDLRNNKDILNKVQVSKERILIYESKDIVEYKFNHVIDYYRFVKQKRK